MKKKLIVSIALALVIVAVLAVCLSGCDSKTVLEEYTGGEYKEIYAKLSNFVSGWIRVDSYRIYNNGVVVIETTYATNYGEIQKTKFVTSLSQVTFQCSNNGRLM